MTKEKGGCGLTDYEGCVRSEENNLGGNERNFVESLIGSVRIAEVVDTKDVASKDGFKRI